VPADRLAGGYVTAVDAVGKMNGMEETMP
jgi:hypothetical protein